MNIHTYEKLWLIAAMGMIVLFIGTITYGSVGLGIAMISDDEETISPNELSDDERFGDPRVEHVGGNEYEAYVVAYTFVFRPDPIEIPAGSEVTFYVTSGDVIHSFSLAGTNVNTMVIPGEISKMTVEFDEPGEYGVVCNEYCGPGHHDMEGLVVVHPAEEFNMTEFSADAPNEVAPDEAIEFEVAIENRLLDGFDTTVTLDVGDEWIEEPVSVPGSDTLRTTLTVDAADLGEGEHDWSVAIDGYDADGTVTVAEPDTDDGDGDDGDTEDGDGDDGDTDDGDGDDGDTEDGDGAPDDADADGGDE